MDKEIVIALIALFGVLFSSVLGYFAVKNKHRLQQAEKEIKVRHEVMDFGLFLKEWNSFEKGLHKLMASSPVDRFLVLRAWNGHYSPRWTTAVFQHREEGQRYESYMCFELDDDYQKKLIEVEQRGYAQWNVSDMQNSEIRNVYEVEGVTSVAWFFISSIREPKTGCRVINYCSFATHSGEMDLATMTRCRNLVGIIKSLAYFSQKV